MCVCVCDHPASPGKRAVKRVFVQCRPCAVNGELLVVEQRMTDGRRARQHAERRPLLSDKQQLTHKHRPTEHLYARLTHFSHVQLHTHTHTCTHAHTHNRLTAVDLGLPG